MPFKKSYFNGTLFRKNLSRFWPLWGLATFLGSLLPLAIWLQLVRENAGFLLGALEVTETYYYVVSYGLPVISLLYAVLCAMTVWSYLYNARSVGLLHTLPIRREGLFLTNFLSGMAMMLIPYVVSGGLAILVTTAYGGFNPTGICVTILSVVGMSFFYFASATFVAFLTGNIFALPALYFLVHFLKLLVDWLVSSLARGFIFGLSNTYSGVADWLWPTGYLMNHLRPVSEYEELVVPGQPWTSTRLISVELEGFWLIGAYALVGLGLLALAYVMYRRRHSERAGDVVATGWMTPVFRYGVAALVSLIGGRALYILFWNAFQQSAWFDLLPMAVSMAVAGVIGYYAASMLLAKSLRVFHKNWIGAVAIAAVAVVLCAGLRYDVLKIADRVPAIDQMKEMELSVAGNTYTFYPGEEDALLEQVRALHAAIAAEQEELRRRENGESWRADVVTPRQEAHVYLRMEYLLRGNLPVSRQYALRFVPEEMAQEGTWAKALDDLVNSTAMREKRIHLGDARYTIDSGELYLEPRGESVNMNSREAQAVLDAVGRDAAAGNWGRHDWFGTDRDAYALNLSLRFQTEEGRGIDVINITLRPEMTETVACLKGLKVLTDEDLVTNAQLYPQEKFPELTEEAALAELVPMAETTMVGITTLS